jgi:hemoglobin-like flavoprotein
MDEAMRPTTMMMTSEQRRLVRLSFDSLRDQSRAVVLLFYGRLFELDPSARELFHNDLAANGRKLMDTLGSVADSLDSFEATRAVLVELGRKHAGFGVRTDQYETVSSALTWTLGQVLGADFDARTREAWKLALAMVVAAMKEGHPPA